MLEKTKEGRNINRHYYGSSEIAEEVKRPVVQALLKLFTFRNESAAFALNGSIEVDEIDNHTILITHRNQGSSVVAQAKINLKDLTYHVTENGKEITFL